MVRYKTLARHQTNKSQKKQNAKKENSLSIGSVIMSTAWGNTVNSNDLNKSNNIPRIGICIPYFGNLNLEWIEMTYIPLLYKQANWCQKLAFLCKVPSIPVSRDMLIKQALQQNCDYIFFVDTDLIFEEPSDPNTALYQLYQKMNKSKYSKDGKIISGLYRAKKDTSFHYAMWKKHDNAFVPIVEWKDNFLEVDVSGAGCCLIDTEVFKNIPRPYFRWEESGEMSEDFYFFQLAKKNGYNLHILTDVKMSHLGNIKIKCNGTILYHEM